MLGLPLAFILSQDQTLRCIKKFQSLCLCSRLLSLTGNFTQFSLLCFYLNIFKELFFFILLYLKLPLIPIPHYLYLLRGCKDTKLYLFSKKKIASLEYLRQFKIGDDLLSHECSTIGANGLNFSVRNGKRWNPVAIVT